MDDDIQLIIHLFHYLIIPNSIIILLSNNSFIDDGKFSWVFHCICSKWCAFCSFIHF